LRFKKKQLFSHVELKFHTWIHTFTCIQFRVCMLTPFHVRRKTCSHLTCELQFHMLKTVKFGYAVWHVAMWNWIFTWKTFTCKNHICCFTCKTISHVGLK
jgi:hypothetical protein